ncbi:hypothetical protein OHB39_36300 [Streptomyces sp. NBC_00047]|uniref:hypothetical protein n=1 Tax=Streptomyces sp. NBC_00047 TaxID=2975627 RepID=UPI00225965C2|nr:hypothetical protein [Streptomyces sp. NBC_00047]MCX5612975.1 hypothetical protein [Streptomyces sp. NBC_00047]
MLKEQLSDARTARADVERAGVVASLAADLQALEEHARLVPEDTNPPRGEDVGEFRMRQREAEKQWKDPWRGKLRQVKIGALHIKDEKLRRRLIDGLRYGASLHMLEYATHHRSRRWVLCGLVDDMTQSLFAWRRGEAELPDPNRAFEVAKESFDLKAEEGQMIAEAEEEDRQQRRSQGDQGQA